MRDGFLLVLAVVLASIQPAEWKDPSPHVSRLVTVDDGVQLEVLDWGGAGPPLVLLAGLGDTAHVYDEFAPTLTPTYRVIGVTRRAHGRSSAPATGYGFARLAEDLVRVFDAMGISKPVVVGHSMAGEELHVLGARYAARVAGLVYVDAAFNRGSRSEDYEAVARTLPPVPSPGPADFASFATLRAFLERTQGFAGPEAHLRARYIANPDGTIARLWTPAPAIFQAISSEIKTATANYNPEPIRVPALALYAVPKAPADLIQPWYNAGDPDVRDAIQKLFPLARERFARHVKWFQALSAGAAVPGRVAEIAGAHHLFLSNPREVREQLDAFMASLASPPVASQDPLLDRASAYVTAFEKTFAAVTWREHYEQEDRQQRRFGSSGARVMQLMGKRQLESQLLFVFLPREASWIAVRDVIAVDGKAQGDANRRLQKLSAGGSISVAALKTLAAENGRFNIGGIVRTFNEPTLVLLFLDERYRHRFEFEPKGEETRKAGRVRVYRFVERGRPTVIQSNNRDLPSQGLLGIEPGTGRILFTSLFLMDGANVHGNLETEYGAQADFDVLVPTQMKEVYNSINGEEVKAVATYSDFRRFEAHSRIIVP